MLTRGSFTVSKDRKYLYLVEGKTDAELLKRLQVDYIYITHGTSLVSRETYSYLDRASSVRTFVTLFDPDGPGKRLEEAILARYKDVIRISVKKSLAIKKRKVGIAKMALSDLKEALSDCLAHDNKCKETRTISEEDLLRLKLVGADSFKRREKLCRSLHLAIGTKKSLLNSLNILALQTEEVEAILNE